MTHARTRSFLWSRSRGKRFRHPRRMRNPQLYVSGKRPTLNTQFLELSHLYKTISTRISITTALRTVLIHVNSLRYYHIWLTNLKRNSLSSYWMPLDTIHLCCSLLSFTLFRKWKITTIVLSHILHHGCRYTGEVRTNALTSIHQYWPTNADQWTLLDCVVTVLQWTTFTESKVEIYRN